MASQDVYLAFNGEIYNAPELRNILLDAGHTFRGHSDTEVILNGYLQWGEEVVPRLSGMFAIAIWDAREQSMFLVRDRVGIKPLFYTHSGENLVFASEIKAILKHPNIHKSIHTSSIDSYLALGYVPGPETIFEGVFTLPPAHFLRWKNGVCEVKRYWQISDSKVVQDSESDLVDELDSRLNRAVESHLLADVDIGAFLSGGVDSSLVCAIAAKKMGAPLKTFTIGFDGGGDERGWAEQVATHIHSEHHAHVAGLDLVEKLPTLLSYLEQPLLSHVRVGLKPSPSGEGFSMKCLSYGEELQKNELDCFQGGSPFGWGLKTLNGNISILTQGVMSRGTD